MNADTLKAIGFMELNGQWILPTFSPPVQPRCPPVLLPCPDEFPIGAKIWQWGPRWHWHLKDGFWVHEQLGGLGQHDGFDLVTPIMTPVRAPCPGLTLKCGWQDPQNPRAGYGRRIMSIARGRQFLGFENPCFTIAHLSEIVIPENHQFEAGDLLGYTGDTGNVSGPHCHVKFWHRDNMPFEVLPLPMNRWLETMQHI